MEGGYSLRVWWSTRSTLGSSRSEQEILANIQELQRHLWEHKNREDRHNQDLRDDVSLVRGSVQQGEGGGGRRGAKRRVQLPGRGG